MAMAASQNAMKKIKKLLVMDNKDAIKGIVTMTDIVNYLPTLYE